MSPRNININPFNLIKYKYTKPENEYYNFGHLLNRYQGEYSQDSCVNEINNYYNNFSYFNDMKPNSINIDVDLFECTLYGINNLILKDGNNFKQHFTKIKNQIDFDVKVESLIKLIYFFEEGYKIVYGHTSSDFWGLVESSNFMNKTFFMLYVYLCLSEHHYDRISSIKQMGKNYSTVFEDGTNNDGYRVDELNDIRNKLDNASKVIIEVASQPQYKQAILDYYTYYAERQKMPLNDLLNRVYGSYSYTLLEQILQLTKDED